MFLKNLKNLETNFLGKLKISSFFKNYKNFENEIYLEKKLMSVNNVFWKNKTSKKEFFERKFFEKLKFWKRFFENSKNGNKVFLINF